MQLQLPKLERAASKTLNMPITRGKTRYESFCENCRQKSIKWGFCFICGLEVR